MKATQQLKDEHEGIKTMLSVMEKISDTIEKGMDLNIDHFSGIIEFLKGFADKCHHGKEEDILFPAMVNNGVPEKGGPIAVMLMEHQMGREYIKSMSEGLDSYRNGNKAAIKDMISFAMQYVDLLRNHIEKENNIFFMMADRVINETEQSAIYEAFEKLEIEKIGSGKHEEYHQLLKELRDIYLA